MRSINQNITDSSREIVKLISSGRCGNERKKVHAQFLTAGIADPLGAIAAANEGLVPVENLEYSCHATKLLLQRFGVFCQHFEQIC